MSETRKRAKYTLEFKMEAVRLVKGGQAVSVTAKVLGIPKASLDNWVKLSAKGQLKGAGDKPVSAEQMELARLRAQLARVTMERDILKKATACVYGRPVFPQPPERWMLKKRGMVLTSPSAPTAPTRLNVLNGARSHLAGERLRGLSKRSPAGGVDWWNRLSC